MIRQNRVVIDMDVIRSNYRVLSSALPQNTEVMAVIKANAYGHGLIETAMALADDGADRFAVALAEEGIALRLAGIAGEILVLGASTPRAVQDCIRYHLTQTVFTPEMVMCIEQAATAENVEALIHIKLALTFRLTEEEVRMLEEISR